MSQISGKELAEYRRLLDEMGDDHHGCGCYCIFKEFLMVSHPPRRIMVQVKCCDKFKFERSQAAKNDIGWKTAWELWDKEGFAAKFDIAYSESKTVMEVYRDTMSKSSA